MWQGREVTEVDDDGTRHVLGTVHRVHWRTWGPARDAHPHSLTLTHRVHLRKHRVHTVLVWSGGRWRNRLHARARYLVAGG